MSTTEPESVSHQETWWSQFFDDDYAAYGLSESADDEKVASIVNFLCSELSLSPGSTVFDQCCGVGRLSIPLAQRGIKTTGVDITASYIKQAQQRATAEKLPCSNRDPGSMGVVGKMVPRPCDAAFNWFTSFGYEEDDQRNRLLMQCAFDSLGSGGRFAMDYMNIPNIMATYRQWFIDRRTTDEKYDLIVLHEPDLDFTRGMIGATWTYVYPDGTRVEKKLAVRMFMPHELKTLLELTGFTDVKLLGTLDSEPLERLSPRCVITATKP